MHKVHRSTTRGNEGIAGRMDRCKGERSGGMKEVSFALVLNNVEVVDCGSVIGRIHTLALTVGSASGIASFFPIIEEGEAKGKKKKPSK